MTDIVNTGSTANDGTGDALRDAFIKLNNRLAQFEGNVRLDERFIGAASSNPTTRLNGSALAAGDWYYYTTGSTWRIYTGSAWVTAPDILAATLAATSGASLIGYTFGAASGPDRTLEDFANTFKRASQVTSGTGSASEDTPALQALLDLGGHIYLDKPAGGYYALNDTLQVGSNTHLYLEPGTYLRQVSGTNKKLITNTCAAASWTDVSAGVTWVGTDGWVVSIAWPSHGLAKGDAVWLDSSDQAVYCGLFTVDTVPDANTITCTLWDEPDANPTGTLRIKRANVNITIENLDLDYNATQNTSSVGDPNAHASVFAGIRNFKIRNTRGRDTKKFLLCTAALDRFEIDGVSADNTLNSDCCKVYGPAIHGRVVNVGGHPGDDMLSLQCREPSAFSTYRLSNGGNIRNVTTNVRAIAGADGVAVATSIYPSGWGGARIDEITLEGYTGHLDGTLVSIYDYEGGGTIGTVRIKGLNCHGKYFVRALANTGATTIECLDVELGANSQNTTGADMIIVDTGVTVANLIVRGSHINRSTIGNGSLIRVQDTGQVNTLVLDGVNYTVSANYFITFAGASKTIKSIDFYGCHIETTYSIISGVAFTGNPTITVHGGRLKGYYLFEIDGNARLTVLGTRLEPSQKVLLATSASAVNVIFDSRGSRLASGEWMVGSGSATISPRSFEIVASLAASWIARAAGNAITTNSSVGTIPAGAACLCDETGTSNSWHGVADPATQKY